MIIYGVTELQRFVILWLPLAMDLICPHGLTLKCTLGKGAVNLAA